ncbi:MAG: hypothetical protein HYY23_04850 [Verrucomicrobia bacterium]|nr:hypothetical protein [Verrucomicrobiota bacterium]
MQSPDSRRLVRRVVASAIFSLALMDAVLAEPPLPQVERLKTSPVLQHLKPNPMPAPPRTPAEQTVAQMYLPEGFRAELVVGEPDLHQPVSFAFDERGRIWVAEAYSYPAKRPAGQGLDKIVIFEDGDSDGKFEKRKTFAEGLNLVSGFEVGYGGVWVGAAPELLLIPDGNHDDVPDGPPQVLLDGFGYQDTHECLNSFLWGPDGWLYGNQGVFNTAHIGKPGAPDSQRIELRAGVWRYHPVTHTFEVFAHGGSNQWGLDYDERGQLFMTHCRSYWGRGGTTHVIQGGHYWNQANANHAPFIIAHPPEDFPGFRNYLLASARYDHGAGGAGVRGSDAIYGGHSHVGTMIYLGDNWPDEFRGHLFTHNLGGHQINHQINKRLGSGFETVHAGRDHFFCSDPKYVAVDLQYGPDGAVYTIDWYDQQHCHNPNTERWDRGNGRIYRIQYDSTYKPVKVNLAAKSDLELVELLRHKNEWFARMAQQLLNERYVNSLPKAQSSRPDALRRSSVERRTPPHPGPLPQGEGILQATQHPVGNAGTVETRRMVLPLPKGEGRGEGERIGAYPVALGSGPSLDPLAIERIVETAKTDPSPTRRLRGLWAAKAVGQFSFELSKATWKDPDEYVRAWAVRLWTDREMKPIIERELVRLAKNDPSPVVRLHLASAMQKVSEKYAWEIAEALAQRAEDREDRNLPFLLWHGIAARMPKNPDRAFAIAAKSALPQLGDYIHWYAATLGGKALNRVVASLEKLQGDALRRRLIGLALAMENQPNVSMPAAWRSVAPKLYTSDDPRVRRQAERLAAVFGDESLFPRLREILADANADAEWRRHAFAVLSRAQDRASLPVFLRLLDDTGLRSQALNLLARFDAPEIPAAILRRFETFSIPERAAAMNALTRRPSFALALLDAVASGQFKREQLTAFHVRQLTDLRNPEVDKRAAAVWGRIQQTAGEKQAQVVRQEKIFNEAPLWAYDAGAGRQHFQKLCAQCHVLRGEGTRVGPELTGAGKNGIRYFLENVVDPDAVVGTDFQVTTIETRAGDAISGLLVNESPSALTIRTTTDQVVVPKTAIARRALSEKSLMPEGLLESLNPREQIELLKFLTNN